ncbi:putative Ig domain-containing protein [Rhodanobacter sp. A1T4]|uniref:putative Ig domain-containing protein n=1 Tax=Rhodanobacter sp. A1T4 TaxID=2723087 RepID=UPI001C88714C|nr:putative Ig domain-containing protein [Rhodanobacter sp. A1T4]
MNPGDDLTTAALYTAVSPVTTYVYDALGHTLSSTVSAGGLSEQTVSTYNALGQQVTSVDANGNVTTYTYDNNGNVLTQVSTLTGNITTGGTTTVGAVSTVTSTYTYDADNQQLTTAVQRSGQSGYDSYTQVKYNAFGEVVAKGDNNGYEATYTYNNVGLLTTAPDSKTGAIHSYIYDLAGSQVVDLSTATGGGNGVWTGNTLDLAGHAIARVVPVANAIAGESSPSTFTYDRWGNVLSSTDAAGNVTQYQYDSQNQLIREIEPNVLVVSATGVRTFQTPTKSWYYNVQGQLIGVTDEDGNTSLNTYDAAGNLTIAQDATGANTTTAYDALGRAVAQETPPANTLSGPLTHITYTSYNSLNQVTAQGDFLINSAGNGRTQQAQETYVLNSNGDRLQVTDALGNTSYYSYDSQHRVLSSQTPVQHASGWAETFTYDVNGNQTGETTADGDQESWAYDYFGRVQSHIDLSGATTTYTYDASSGLLTSESSNWAPAGQTNPGYLPSALTGTGSSEQYQYDADGQVAKFTQLTGGTVAEWDTYQYDVNGNQTVDATYTTDGAGLVVHTETVSSYDSHNRLSVETTENPDNSVANSRLVYNYDAAGNRRAVFAQSAYGTNASPVGGNGGPPTGTVSAQTAAPGAAWNFSVAGSFTDNVGFGLTFSATQSNGSALPSWMTLNSSGNFGGTPSTAGTWSITVTATDVNGQSVSSTFTVTVPLVTPVFTAGATNQVGSVNTAFSFTVPGATDANGLAISYAPAWVTSNGDVPLPSWLSFNASTLTFSGTPPGGSAGTYTIAYGASAGGFNPIQTFTYTVLSTPPVANGSIGSQTVYGTHAFAFSFPSSIFNESDGDALTYSAGSYAFQSIPGEPTVENDSTLPSWMTFYPSSLTFAGTPPASAVGQTFKLYVMATNPQGQKAETYFSVSVSQYVQPAPVYNGNLANQTGVIGGASLNLTLPANAFVEPDGGALTYTGMVLIPAHTLTVNKAGEPTDTSVAAVWTSISDVGLSVNATTGAITGVPTALTFETSNFSTAVYEHDSTYQLEIIATNAQGGTASGALTLTNSYAPPAVTGAIPAQTLTPNGSAQVYSIPAVFSDPYGHGLTYTSNAPAWAGFASNGTFTFNGTTESAGTYNWTITATDGLGHTGSTTISVTVNNVAPVFNSAAANETVNPGAAFSFTVPGATSYNGSAISYVPAWVTSTAWVPLPSWLNFNGTTRTFSGTPPSGSAGTYTIVYGAAANGFNPVQSFTITVISTVPPGAPPTYNGMNTIIQWLAGKSKTWTVPTTAFTNPSGQPITYTMTNQGGGPLDSEFVFGAVTPSTLSGTARDTTSDRTIDITLTATDPASGKSVSVNMEIDIAGDESAKGKNNAIAQVATTQAAVATTPNIQAEWFTYDADNRVEVNDGSLVNGQIVLTPATYENTTYANEYDAAGNVAVLVTDVSGVTMIQGMEYDQRNELVETDYALSAGQASLGAQQRQSYDADGHLLSTYQYLNNKATESVYGTVDMPEGTINLRIGGWVDQGETSTYNADGQVTAQVSLVSPYTNWLQVANTFEQDGTMPDGTNTSRLAVGSTTTYTAFDAADNVTAYSYVQNAPQGTTTGAFGANYTVSYLKKDGYLQQSTAGTPTVSGYVPATDTTYYDAFGRTIAVAQTSQSNSGAAQNTTRAYAYDTAGQILEERSGTISGTTLTPTNGYFANHYTYVNGQQVSDMDEEGEIGVATTLTGFSTSTQGYVVQVGDTLASIAQTEYGNSDYGYIIGEANGLSSTSTLVPGQSITIPSVTTSSNTATTFKPYNAGSIIGSTTPNLPTAPPPPPPSSSGCSGLAEMLVVAVAIVVTIYTAGAAAEAFGAAEVGGSTLATGAAALGGTLTATGAGIAGAVVGGIAGSVAGQLTGDALGVSQGFSLEQALTSGLAAGLTAGIGGEISSSGEAVLANAKGVLTPTGAALFGAGAYASGVAADKVTGEATHFSWAGLAASAVASGITAAAGLKGEPLQQVGDSAGSFTQDVAGGLLSGGLTRETSQLLGDNHVSSWQQIGEDAFGNALGNAAAGAINAAQVSSAEQTASFSRQASSQWSQDQASINTYANGWNQGLGELAFEQEAQTLMANSPQLVSADAYSTYTGVHGLVDPDEDAGSSEPSYTLQSPNGDVYAPITLPGYASFLETNADGTPYLFQNKNVTDLSQVTVSATANYLSLNNPYAVGDDLDQQLADVLPGSAKWAQLQGQAAVQGLGSADPVAQSQGALAALQLNIRQTEQEMAYNGGIPMSQAGAIQDNSAQQLALVKAMAAAGGPLDMAAAGYSLRANPNNVQGAMNSVAFAESINAGMMAGFAYRSAVSTGLESGQPIEYQPLPVPALVEGQSDVSLVEPGVPNAGAVDTAAGASGSPSQLVSGQAAEPQQLAALNSTGKVPFTPSPDQVNSAAFQVIVGKPQYTASGDLVGTIYDGLNEDGLAEIKTGSSTLDSSYQLRLQTYGALVNDPPTPLTIYTSRPVNPTFQNYLTRWGVSVQPLPY